MDRNGRTIFVADVHRDGQRFVVRADEKLTAFMELESAIRSNVPSESKSAPRTNKRLLADTFGGALNFVQWLLRVEMDARKRPTN